MNRSESHGSGNNRRTVHYYGNETYLNNGIALLRPEGNQDLFIQAGDWSYPFSFVLPPNIPSTFKHVVGSVSYCVEAHLEIPW